MGPAPSNHGTNEAGSRPRGRPRGPLTRVAVLVTALALAYALWTNPPFAPPRPPDRAPDRPPWLSRPDAVTYEIIVGELGVAVDADIAREDVVAIHRSMRHGRRLHAVRSSMRDIGRALQDPCRMLSMILDRSPTPPRPPSGRPCSRSASSARRTS
jgi:hypothetical protein